MPLIVRGILRIKGKKPTYNCPEFNVEGFEFKLSKLNKRDTAIVYPLIYTDLNMNKEDLLGHYFHSYRSYFDPSSIIITVEKGFYPDFWVDIFKEEG